RFEEAADVRDRIRSIAEALARRRQDAWLIGAGRLTIRDAEGRILRFRGGALETENQAADAIPLPCPRERSDELAAVRSWLQRNAVTVEACDRPPAERVEGGAALARMQRPAGSRASCSPAAPTGSSPSTPAMGSSAESSVRTRGSSTSSVRTSRSSPASSFRIRSAS